MSGMPSALKSSVVRPVGGGVPAGSWGEKSMAETVTVDEPTISVAPAGKDMRLVTEGDELKAMGSLNRNEHSARRVPKAGLPVGMTWTPLLETNASRTIRPRAS